MLTEHYRDETWMNAGQTKVWQDTIVKTSKQAFIGLSTASQAGKAAA